MSTWSFMEAMLMFPDVQKKAQAEIGSLAMPSYCEPRIHMLISAADAVVKDRLPLFSDLDQIPYVRCMMKEVWRWRPPVALGHPHTWVGPPSL